MDDTISRLEAICAIEEYADRLQMVNWEENPGVPYKVHSLNWAINTLRDLPSAERRGKKKVYYHGENTFSYVCDQCNMPIDGKDAFCKWCGARMEE